MANCLDQILCNQASDCNISITDKNGFEIDTRYLHDGDPIYLYVGDRIGYTLQGFSFLSYDGTSRAIYPEYVGNNLYTTEAICGGTFIAHFSTNIYELTVISDNDMRGSTLGSGRYPYNTCVHISAIENNGYHFVGWYINDVLISNNIEYSYTVISNVIIVAKFEGDEYSIVAKPNNRLLGRANGSGVFEYGDIITLTATPFVGSRFISWDDGDTNPAKIITVTENKIYIANFQRNRYTVTVNILNASTTRPLEVCGVVTGEGVYEYGTVVTLYASPALGFSFTSWDNGPEHIDGNTRYSFTIQGNTVIMATFDDAMYTLTLYSSPTNGGYTGNSVSTEVFTGGTYRYNTIVPSQAIPYSGYLFDKWSDGTLSDVRSFVMTSDIIQTAYFMPDIQRYTLKILFDQGNGNVVIMDGLNNVTLYGPGYAYATVDSGTILTAIVTVNPPYSFGGWDDSSSEGMIRLFTMDGYITREVYFDELSKYTICVCTGFEWKNGHFVAYYNGETKQLTIDDKCVDVTNGTVLRIEYVQDNPYYAIDNWDTTGLGTMDYTINDQEINITVTDNGEICADIIQNKADIGVQNNPGVILANQVDFTVNYDGGPTEYRTPNNDIKYIGPITSYPTPVNYTVSVTTPTITGYHFTGITGSDGSTSYGTDTISGILPNTGIVFTCNYEMDVCNTEFNFDYQNAATLTIDGRNYRTNTGIITTSAETFTISADTDYYISDVIDTNTGNPIGACQYCYTAFPIPDSNGIVYYYRIINYGNIPSGATITTIYTPTFILNGNSPQYVKYVKPGASDVYAELISRNLSVPTPFDDIWGDLCDDNKFYNFDTYDDEYMPSLVNSATETSPNFIMTKGSDSFFAKAKTNCLYTIQCGHTYQICMLNGNYNKPLHVWDPVTNIPIGTPSSEILIDTTDYKSYSYFYYTHNPDIEYSSGKRYALVTINGIEIKLHLVNNC